MATTKPTKKISRRAVLGGAAALTATVGGGVAWAADRYLIPHVEVSDTSQYEAEQVGTTTSSSPTSSAEATESAITSDGYIRDGLELKISEHSTGSGSNKITYFVADIALGDAANLKTAMANNQFGTNITANVSEIANDNDAVFAINGDYYGFRDTGIVIRNGVKYRDEPARQGLAFYNDGSMRLYEESSTSADELLADGVTQTWSFGPGIVDGGSVISGIDSVEVDTNFGNHSIQGEQPRTGIGMIEENHLVFIVVDGRSTGYSRGVTMTEFAEIFVSLGAQTAYNLDGGGSAEMWFNGDLVNNPLGKGRERATSDIIYFA